MANITNNQPKKDNMFKALYAKTKSAIQKARLFDRTKTVGKTVSTGVGYILAIGNTIVVFTLSLPLITYTLGVAGLKGAFDAIAGTFNKTAQKV